MSTTLKIQQSPADYVPPTLKHDTNGWYLLYYVFNPIIGQLERKKIRLNQLKKRCRSIMEFRIQVDDIIRTIESQLRTNSLVQTQAAFAGGMPTMPQGYMQPYMPQQPMYMPGYYMPAQQAMPTAMQTAPAQTYNLSENIRFYMTLDEVMKIYIEEKLKELRKSTTNSYNSFCNLLRKWINEYYPGIKVSMFSRVHAVEFLDAMSEKNINPSTYNNLIRHGSALFVWAKEKCYARENPFEGHKRKRTLEKKRTIIRPEDQRVIDQWFAEHRPAMCIVCRLVYTSLLRPIEITRVQVKQLDFEHHCIIMPGEKTKTWEQREGRMDAELEEMLREHIRGAKPDDYIFTSNNLQCGKEPVSDKRFSKDWVKMRDALHMPKEYQLYSLKDTAITRMLKAGVDDLSVMQAAGHKDLSMTTIYADHRDDKLIENLNRKAPKFGEY